MSESEAFHRITAARLARKFPVIFELLEARAIHLSGLRVLRDHLTSENHRELLASASGKSKKEVEALVARLAPRPDVASRIRKLLGPRRQAPLLLNAAATPVAARSSVVGPSVTDSTVAGSDVAPVPWGPDNEPARRTCVRKCSRWDGNGFQKGRGRDWRPQASTAANLFFGLRRAHRTAGRKLAVRDALEKDELPAFFAMCNPALVHAG